MDNKYTGVVTLKIGQKTYNVCYDWTALAALKSNFEESDIAAATKGQDIDKIADILVIGMKKHHPDITKEFIMEQSPPFLHTVQAIDRALAYAYFGPDEPAQAEKKNTAKPKK